MAEITQIKLPSGNVYNIKDTSAIPSNTAGNTQNLVRPKQLNGVNDNTLDAKINTLRANRLAFLPADQIIIEKTTDGGTTWTDAQISDANKVGLFSETRAAITIPLLDGVKNINCGLRVTITGMKYNVPANTAETAKYNYWNSNYILSTERYNQLKEMYFWVSANTDTIGVKVERATGAASTNWITIFENNNYGMNGWSGNDYISFNTGVFGGGTNQTGNYWNYRLTFFTRGPGGSTTLAGTNPTSAQQIFEIRGYGNTWWTAGNNYAANDHLYNFNYLKEATFPSKVTATSFAGDGASITNLNAGNISSGTLPVARGGTGATSFTANSVIISGTSTTAALTTKGITDNSSAAAISSTDTNLITGRTLYNAGYTKNTGTITGVTGGTGLSGSATSGSVTINHSNSITAQTTQAVYPIKIDAQGHISAYGSAVTIPAAVTSETVSGWGFTKNAGTITGVTGGTGLSGSGTSGAVTINHSNSITAQTTEAVYPQKIDAQGHISAYGSAIAKTLTDGSIIIGF